MVKGSLPTDNKERKAIPIWTGVIEYFPKILLEVAQVSRDGNEQNNPGEPLHWAQGKSTDHMNCMMRHAMEHGTRDTDGRRHIAKAIWRLMAQGEMEIEAEQAGMSTEYYIQVLEKQEAKKCDGKIVK